MGNPSRDDLIADGDQLGRIRNELGPLERLLARKRDDLFREWSSDEKLTKDFCRGALSVIDTLMADIEQLSKEAIDLRAEREEEDRISEEIRQSPALDGGGHGDLAS